jgi:hypothetical protein
MSQSPRRSPRRLRPGLTLLAALAAVSLAGGGLRADDDKDGKNGKDDKEAKRPTLVLRANPAIAFAPARVNVSAELRGGSDSDAELYCPDLEWEWDDNTFSESSQNCEPFVAGKSQITRRWRASHTFTTGGEYQIYLRLKRGGKTVLAGNTRVEVRRSAQEFGDFD